MSDQEHLDRIREIVQDENRIVTYKLLSKELNISVNDAKSILRRFVKEERSKKCDEFVVCYCVSGLKKMKLDDHERQINVVCVVPDKKLEQVKSSLKVVSGEHVYSVQRSSQNSCSLYTTDIEFRDERHLKSAVKCDNVKPRSGNPRNAEIGKNVSTKDVSISHKDGPSNAKDVVDGSSKDTKSEERVGFTAKTNTNKTKFNTKENKNKTSLANMFANQASKEKSTKLKEKDNVQAEPKLEVVASKETSVPENKATKTTTNKRPTTRGRKNVRSKSKTKAEVEAPPKRRRILVSDTSSSESEEEEDPLANIDIVEPEDPVPSPVRNSPSKNCKNSDDEGMDVDDVPVNNTPGVVRQKKVVSKMFVDEDGYLVTKKVTEIVEHVEKVSETTKTSMDENAKCVNNKERKESSVASKKSSKSKKPSPPKNIKQASLMSFFKKA